MLSLGTLRGIKDSALLRGSTVYLISNLTNAALMFALMPLLTRVLGPSAYGQVAMFQTLLGLLEAFVGLSVAGAAGRKYFDNPSRQRELALFIAVCLQVIVITGCIAFIIILLWQQQLSRWLSLPPNWLPWAVFVSAGTAIINIMLGQWQIRGKTKQFSILQVSQSMFFAASSLLLIVAMGQGANGRIAAQALVVGIFATVSLALLNRHQLLCFITWKPAYLRETIKFGAPLTLHFSGIFFLAAFDRLIISSRLGIAEAGMYMVGVQLTNAMSLLFDAFNKAYGPWLFERLKRDNEKEKRQLVTYTYGWFVALLVVAGLAFLVGPSVVIIVAGIEYEPAGKVIGWLALGQAFNGMYFMVTNYIFYAKRTGLLSLASITSGLVNVALLTLFVTMLGLRGAAIAFCISMATRLILTWWIANKCHPMPWLAVAWWK
jgi:O-antigen/teichoic acid export membrane protein